LAQETGLKITIGILKNGGVGVMPTDTIYGIVGSALSERSVKRIYKLRKRSSKKPMIILIGSIKDLGLFKIKLSRKQRKILGKLWPGKVSVVLPCKGKKFYYLHRGTQTLAFRLPKPKWLTSVLKKTGPLVAPSANLEGEKPASTAKEAKKYFRWQADFYWEKGKLNSKPSTLVSLKNGKVEILREGIRRIRL